MPFLQSMSWCVSPIQKSRQAHPRNLQKKIQDMLDHLCGVLGVAEVAEEEVSDEDVAKIEALIAERTEAKKAKDFAKADAIRDELAAMGITIKDTRQGVQWFRG